MAGPGLEEGEGGLHGWGAGVGVGVGNWDCRWGEEGDSREWGGMAGGGKEAGGGARVEGAGWGVDVWVVRQVSWRAIGWGQGSIGGALGLHHGLQALVTLSGHVGAGGRHPGHVAGGWWWRRPVWQRRPLVHGAAWAGGGICTLGRSPASTGPGGSASPKGAERGGFGSGGGWAGGNGG